MTMTMRSNNPLAGRAFGASVGVLTA